MSEKQRGEVTISFAKGCFREFSGLEPIQFYQIYERELHTNKTLEQPVFPEGVLLIYCVAGEAKLRSKSETLMLQENTVVLCSADVSYSVELSDRQKGMRFICLNLHISEKNYPITALSSLCAFYANASLPMQAKNAMQIKDCLTCLLSEMSEVKKSVTLLIRDLIYQILVVSYRYFNRCDIGLCERDMTVHVVGHTAYAIIRYVDEHLYSMNNLANMAKELGYSYNYLSHLFRRKTGMTIQSYVSQKKIQRSVDLLSDETLSITEIATMLNYDCIQSFSKAFKRMMNMSPTEYRMKNGIFID